MNETGQNSIILGSPVAGRNHLQLQNIIGLFLNVVLIQTTIDINENFKSFLKDVNKNIVEALNHQDYPYEELYNLVSSKHKITQDSLFNIMINYIPFNGLQVDNANEIKGITIKSYNNERLAPKCNITFYIREGMEDLTIDMVYKKSIYDEDMMLSISEAFNQISEIVLKNEDININDINYNVSPESEMIDEIDDYDFDDDYIVDID
jgi:non-ribosomal peptide synthetase component F